MTTSFIHRYGPEIAHDYPVCAIEPGQKRPIGKEWQKHPLSPEECRDYPNEAAGVGIMCGQADNPVYAVDVDVYADADCAHAIYHMIEEVTGQVDLPYRVGNYPKLLVPLIGTEVGWKKMTTAWYEKDASGRASNFSATGSSLSRPPSTRIPNNRTNGTANVWAVR